MSDADELRNAPPTRLVGVDVIRDLTETPALRAADAPGDTPSNNDGSPGTMFGHFSTFNDWYEINSMWEGEFLERIAPGAFKKTISERKNSGATPVRVLLDHGFDPGLGDRPLGVPEVLEERDNGPYAEVPLFEGVPQIVVSGLRAGAYGQSFRFQVIRDEWVEEPDPGDHNLRGIPERTIKEVRLIEFGPTPFPANPAADAGLRSTTDDFYERLRRRDPVTYETALSRAKAIRTSTAPAPVASADTPAVHQDTEIVAESTAAEQRDEAASLEAPSDEPRKHSEASVRPVARARVAEPSPEGQTPMAEQAPMTSEEREARQSEIRIRLQEIDTEYNGATLPPEVQNEWDTINTEFDANERAIAADVKRKARLAEMDARQNGEQVSSMPVPQVMRRPENLFDLPALRQQARSIEEVPSLMRDAAMRITEQARFPGRGVSHSDAAERIQYLLDYVDDDMGSFARRIITTGSPTYQRAFGKACLALSTNTLTGEEQRALAMGAGSTGAFAVPFTLDPTVILTSTGVVNPIRQVARVETITGQQWQGITSAGITVARATEAFAASDNAPTLAQPTVTPTRVQGFVPFSYEVDQDWTGLQSEMFRLLADAKNIEEATAFINGTGVGVNPSGLVKTLNASQQTASTATLTLAMVYGLESSLNPRFRPGASFLASKGIYNVLRNLDTTGGSTLWQRIGFGQPPELLGYPAYEVSTMPGSAPAIGDRWLLFGDCSQFLIVDRLGMSVELIPQIFSTAATPGVGTPTGQRGLYAIWRNSSKILADAAFQVMQRTT